MTQNSSAHNSKRVWLYRATPFVLAGVLAATTIHYESVVWAQTEGVGQGVAPNGGLQPLVDAPTPNNLNWDKAEVQPISSKRAQISLNGQWKFMPAEGATASDPKSGWGYIRVPGNWKNNNDITARGQGRVWQNFNGDKVNAAWYERKITVPADWAGRSIVLDLRRVSTEAQVFVNGKEAGGVNWPAGEVDITKFVTPGQEATIRLRVLAIDDRTQVPILMGYIVNEMRPAVLDNKGIIDDVMLVSRPQSTLVRDVLMRPSTRQKKLFVDVELEGVQQAGNVQLTAKMLNEKGEVEKSFTSMVPVKAGDKMLTAAWDWADARLWDVGQPNLYTMQLQVQGAGLNDKWVQKNWGFREFWIEGRDFYLNGTKFNLRPAVLQYGAMPAERMKQGHNFAEIWPENRSRRGSRDEDWKIVQEADRVGLPISGNALHMGDFIGTNVWSKPEIRADYRRQMEIQIRRARNSPSIVMWGTSGNVFGYAGDGDPWRLGQRHFSNLQEYQDQHERFNQAMAMVKAVDPTRPLFSHFGTYNGEVYTSNLYLNFIPLQEREEWMSHGAQTHSMPYMSVEMGLPLYSTLNRGRDGYTHQGNSESFLSEWGAIYLGKAAYGLEPEKYRNEVLRNRFKNALNKGNIQAEYDPHIRNEGREKILDAEGTSFHKVLDLFITNTWRSWRTMGVTGGMIPWHHDRHPAFQRVNGPSLAWIAGQGGKPVPGDDSKPAWTEKDHSFKPGDTITKQLVFINDHRAPQPYSAQVEVTLGGKKILSQSKTGNLAIGEPTFVPVCFKAPTIAGDKAEGTITLTAKIGPDTHQDTFPFRVFKPAAPSKGTLNVIDPVGDTSAMLKSLGYSVKPWTGGNATGTLVIGRKVLSNKNLVPAGLSDFVRNGGRLLVMGQDPQWTKYALGLRTAPYLSRRVYRIDTGHPVVRGLDDYDLSDWNGASKVVESHPKMIGYEWPPNFGWRWGNRGSVATTPIEKPHRSSWRPILEHEFDLAYTPLMEMEVGKGRVTLSTLDVEDNVPVDPAARKLAAQLLNYVTTAPITPKATKVLYVGDDNGAKTLDDLGVNYKRSQNIGAGTQLLIVGNGAIVNDAELEDFANSGGKVLVLRRTTGNSLGANIEKVDNFHGSTNAPNWPEAAGLSASDLHWRANETAYLLRDSNGWEIGGDGQLARRKVGQGVLVWSQIDPSAVPADEKRYFRFTRWRQTRALSNLLSNLGATFKQDAQTLALLQRPDHAWNLTGVWDAQLTKSVKESPTRQWNGDPGMTDLAKQLVAVNAPATGWEKVPVPAYMESYGPKWRFTDGEVVFRKTINVPAYLAGKDLFLSLGRIDETEETFINGQSVGKTRSWVLGRGHRIPGNLVKAGTNVIAIRTWDEGIHGGFTPSPDELYLRVAPTSGLTNPYNFYHSDYIEDDVQEGTEEKMWAARREQWKIADNPYRYYRW
jgi:beta-galactosidase